MAEQMYGARFAVGASSLRKAYTTSTSTNAIIYDHYLVTISCLVIEVLFAVTKKFLVIEDYCFYDDIQIWS
jgi:hypothetical protein